MKNGSARTAPALLFLFTLILAMAPAGARGDEAQRAQAIALLTSGVWHFESQGWANDWRFDRNGTMFVQGDSAKWKVTTKQVMMVFKDHEDDLDLPLDPKGTKGLDAIGHPFTAVQDGAGQ